MPQGGAAAVGRVVYLPTAGHRADGGDGWGGEPSKAARAGRSEERRRDMMQNTDEGGIGKGPVVRVRAW